MRTCHGGVSEQLNYMLARYRCKGAMNAPKHSKKIPQNSPSESETLCAMSLPRGFPFPNRTRCQILFQSRSNQESVSFCTVLPDA